MNVHVVLILVTTANKAEAEQISQSLVEKKLIACCNIVDSVESIFYWKNEICKESEVLMLLKTKKELFTLVEKEIKQLHSYENPEIVALPIICGSEEYLSWVKAETKKS
ncbi:cytochrome C biogenesis protein CcdA [candidate division KSB1 bacterium 4572_119]|nr:MAG: cytochrome C biogenesis protein CcdA [candidate division KSB1 bacterium 4572_119]